MKIPQSYRKPLLIALLLHVMLAVILIIKLPSLSYQYHGGSSQMTVVHATAVSAAQVQQAIQHINNQEALREHQEAQHLAELREEAQREAQLRQREAAHVAQMKQEQARLKQQQAHQVKVLAALKQQQIKMAQAAQQHALEVKKMQDAKVAQIKAAQAQAAAKAALMKAQQAAAQRVKMQQAAQAQQAAKVVAQQKAQQAAKALALKKQHDALLQQQQRLQQQLMAQQLAGDSNQLQQIQAKQMQGIIDKYKAMILSAIGQNWLVPSGVDKNLSSVFDIQLAPGGVVISVTLVKSSGNDALDQSAQTAIYKTSPLPVPQDPVEFNNFRDLRLTVSPKEVVDS